MLVAHPAVLEAATVGIPDPKRGETVKSFVVLRPGQRATADELAEYCRRELAAYKVPRSFAFLDELPKSSALKILRRELQTTNDRGLVPDRALLHESELARTDPDPQFLHRPMRYDIGLPSPVI